MAALERLLAATRTLFFPTSTNAARMTQVRGEGLVAVLCAPMPPTPNSCCFPPQWLSGIVSEFASRIARQSGVAQAAALLGDAAPHAATVPLATIPPALAARFVKATLPLLVLGLYYPGSAFNPSTTGRALQELARIAPGAVCGAVTSMAATAFDSATVNSSHLTPNAAAALSMLVRTLLWPVPHLAAQLPALLHALLPGIDANDLLKSTQTIAFLSSLLECVPLVDAEDLEVGGWTRGVPCSCVV